MAQMSASDAAAAASGGVGGDDGSEGTMGAAARREAAVAVAGFERAAEQAADALVAATGNDLAAATERLLAAHRRAAASLGQQQQQQSPLRSDTDVRQAQVKLSKEHKLYSAVAVRLFILKHLCPLSADTFQTERAIVPFCSGCSRFGETRNEWALPRPTQDRELDRKATCMRHSNESPFC